MHGDYTIPHPSHAAGEMQHRLRQHSFVAELGEDALKGMALDELFNKAVHGVAEIFENEYCKVLELQPDGKHVLLRAGVGWQPGLVGVAMVDTGMDSQAGYTLASEHPVIVKDLRTETRFRGPALLHNHGVVSGMSVIIHAADGPWGVMGTHTTRLYEFTDYDITFFQTIANVLASAIERRKLEDDLERRVIERTQELVQANELKSQFVATISHEVRTPMAGVIGLAEFLTGQPLTPEQAEVAKHLYVASKRLLHILNDLLDFSRLEAGKMTVERTPFSVKKLLADTVFLFSHDANDKKLDIKISTGQDIPDVLFGDETKLNQVLVNLVSNAIKFTEKGTIEVVAEMQKRSDDEAVIKFSIIDTGVGVRHDAKHLLFQPFVQADSSTTRRFGGSGLGLSICRQYVDLLGGEIGFSSEEGKGSNFWFTVPIFFSNG